MVEMYLAQGNILFSLQVSLRPSIDASFIWLPREADQEKTRDSL